MANSSFVQTSFLAGEWSQSAQGRMDRPEYKAAMNIARNHIPIAPGACPRRPGFELAAPTRNGAYGKIMDFTFQEGTPYTTEITEGVLRFFTGKTPVRTNDDAVIVSISSANPAEVATEDDHDWTDGDRVRFLALGVNNPLLQNREFEITVTGTDTFTLADALTGDAIDGASLGSFVSGSVGRILEIGAPYSITNLASTQKVQINEQFDIDLVLLNAQHKPQVLRIEEEPTDDAFAEFSISPANFIDGPYIDPFKNSTVTPSGLAGLITLTFGFIAYSSSVAYSAGDYVTDSGITYLSLQDQNQGNTPASSAEFWEVATATDIINGGDGLTETDIGRHVRLYSQPAAWDSAVTYALNNTVFYNNVAYKSLQASNTNHTPETSPTWWSIFPAGTNWSWGKITALTGLVGGQISQSEGTRIGNMVNDGGLIAAFDGGLSESINTSATVVSTNAYIGKNFSGSPKTIASVKVYGTNSTGFWGGISQGTINLRASQTAPNATGSNGTLLGTSGLTSDINGPAFVTVISTDQTTQWNYIWVQLVSPGATFTGVGEIEFFNLSQSGGSSCQIQILGDPLQYVTAVSVWRLGVYSDTTGWPRCGVGHEGRLWLSGGIKNRVDASRSNKPFDFAPTEKDGTVTGSNAISYTFNAKTANTIFWMESERQGVLCGTNGGEFLLQATAASNPLTPITVQANKGTRVKCANTPPADCENSLVFIQLHKRRLIEYFADVSAGKFTAPNLSEDAQHLVSDGLAEVVYQQELAPLLWLRDEDGSLFGITYKRESTISSQGPEYKAWHQHDLGSGRKVESMCVGSSADGDPRDTLTIISNDETTNIRHVEVLKHLPPEKALKPLLDAWFCDDAIAPTSYVVSSSAKTVVLNGLWYLNGQEVAVWAGGLDLGDYEVEDGSITVPIAAVPEFTLPYVMSFGGAMPIVVGFSFISQGQLLRPQSAQDTGAQAGPGFGKLRRIHWFAALLVNTKGIEFGTDFSRMKPGKLLTKGGTALTAFQVKSGVHTDTIEDDTGHDGMIAWQITRPYPSTVAAIGGFINTSDK